MPLHARSSAPWSVAASSPTCAASMTRSGAACTRWSAWAGDRAYVGFLVKTHLAFHVRYWDTRTGGPYKKVSETVSYLHHVQQKLVQKKAPKERPVALAAAAQRRGGVPARAARRLLGGSHGRGHGAAVLRAAPAPAAALPGARLHGAPGSRLQEGALQPGPCQPLMPLMHPCR